MGSGFSRDPIGTIPSVHFDPRAAVFITLTTNIVLTLLSGKHLSGPTAACLHQWLPPKLAVFGGFLDRYGKKWDLEDQKHTIQQSH